MTDNLIFSRRTRWTVVLALVAGLTGACASSGDEDEAGSVGSGVGVDASAVEESPYPSLAGVPERPEVVASEEEQEEIARALLADREHARYSAEQLRGGLTPPATPPAP